MKKLKLIMVGIIICSIFLSSKAVQGQTETEKVLNAKAPLQINTYDKSDQMNHPDVIYEPDGWNGFKYWMVFTPYPYGNSKHENPSIRVSNDGIHWEKPAEQLPDPVIPPPLDCHYGGFNSDPDIVLVGKTMYLFYRSTTEDRVTTVYFKTSTDGVEWSDPHVTNLPTTTTSPAMYYDGSLFHCWFVEYTGPHKEPYVMKHCVSDDGRIWSNPGTIFLATPGYTPWHLNVTKTNDGFEMLLTAYRLTSDNGHTVLFHARSVNGLHWRLSSLEPFLKPVKDSWDSKEIYRSAMIKDDSGYKIWYSASDINDRWGIGYITLETIPQEKEPVNEIKPEEN